MSSRGSQDSAGCTRTSGEPVMRVELIAVPSASVPWMSKLPTSGAPLMNW